MKNILTELNGRAIAWQEFKSIISVNNLFNNSFFLKVGRLSAKPERDVLMQDFYFVEKVWFPRYYKHFIFVKKPCEFLPLTFISDILLPRITFSVHFGSDELN